MRFPDYSHVRACLKDWNVKKPHLAIVVLLGALVPGLSAADICIKYTCANSQTANCQTTQCSAYLKTDDNYSLDQLRCAAEYGGNTSLQQIQTLPDVISKNCNISKEKILTSGNPS